MWEEEVHLHTLYDFDYTLQRLSFDPLISINKEQRILTIPVVLHQKRATATVEAFGTTEEPKFYIRSDQKKEEILSFIYDLFQWNVDLSNVMAHFSNTNIASLFKLHPGTPIVRDFDLYYCFIKTIIHQQLNMKFAYVLTTRFVEKYGEKENGVWFYPTPEKIARLSVEELRELQFSGRKAEYVIDASRKIVSGEIDLDEMKKKSNEEIMTELTKLRGVGPWTAQNWLLFGLGRQDLFPKADIGIQNAMKRFLNMDRKPTLEELERVSEGWEPYRSYASLTLWRSIES